jgi:hypothetical protein
VKKGDVLVKFDDKDLRAALESVKARYAAEEAQITVTDLRIKAQENELNAQRISLADAERDLRRQRQLLETRDVSQSTVDTAQARVDNLQSQMLASEQSLAADKSGLIVLSHNLEAAKAEIQRAEDNLSYATIVSPIDGIVTKVEAEVGELALMGTMNNPGTVLLNVADLSKILLVAHVDEASIAQIRVGQKAKVRMQAYGGHRADHPDGHGRDRADQRLARAHPALAHPGDRVGERDIGAGDRGGPGAAVGVQHVAVEQNGVFSQRLVIDASAEGTPDQPGNLVGPAADFAADRFAIVAGIGRPGQHGVFGRNPPLAAAPSPPGHAVLDRGRAQHPRVAELDQHRSLGVGEPLPGDGYGTKLVRVAAILSGHADHPISAPRHS